MCRGSPLIMMVSQLVAILQSSSLPGESARPLLGLCSRSLRSLKSRSWSRPLLQLLLLSLRPLELLSRDLDLSRDLLPLCLSRLRLLSLLSRCLRSSLHSALWSC